MSTSFKDLTFSQIEQAHAAFARAIKLNNRDAGLCTSYALVCMILGDIDAAIISLHEVPVPLSSHLIKGIDDLTCRSNCRRTHESSPSHQRKIILRVVGQFPSQRRDNHRRRKHRSSS